MDEREKLIVEIQEALEHVARRSFPEGAEVKVEFNPNDFQVNVFQVRTVVKTEKAPIIEIDLEEAHVYDVDAKLGDKIKIKADVPDFFSRAAAQTAKTVIRVRLKD